MKIYHYGYGLDYNANTPFTLDQNIHFFIVQFLNRHSSDYDSDDVELINELLARLTPNPDAPGCVLEQLCREIQKGNELLQKVSRCNFVYRCCASDIQIACREWSENLWRQIKRSHSR